MPSILIVDDNDAQRLALAAILAELEVPLLEAASGRQALRHLLEREVAVILMDVNMPGLDGFETAELIRARRSTEHTPIIFITAGDDAHAARGYSLGAVDYILAPVQPDVLRTKVAVFIDLYRKTAEVRAQREALRRYADQLTQLTEASLAINSAHTVEEILRVVEQRAARIIGAQVARTQLNHEALAAARTAAPAHGLNGCAAPTLAAPGPEEGGALEVRLTARDGTTLGCVRLAGKAPGGFTGEDENILVQLAQMASIAIENSLSAEAREANRLKDEFLGVLSHELRTPLQAMLTWIAILRRDGVDAAVQARGIEVVYRSARSQLQLIEDLLDISRIIRGQLRLECGRVDLVRVVTQALDTLKPAATDREVVLDWEPPAEDCALLGDATRLQQVVWNLVSNGVKFTPEGGRVVVRLRPRAETLVIEVADSGPGIPPAFLPHVFERFRQADSSSKRQHGGLGLGLAIVRHLVELHDGSVRAENAPGGGALLTVTLPRRQGAGVLREPGGARLSGAAINGVRLDGIRVLLVEDECDARESLTAALELFGAQVRAVGSAPEALALLASEPGPDVLLSDLGLPGEDGHALIHALRAREGAGRRLPAVALTAYVRSEDRLSALEAGFDLHVEKPIEPLELAMVVRQLAGTR